LTISKNDLFSIILMVLLVMSLFADWSEVRESVLDALFASLVRWVVKEETHSQFHVQIIFLSAIQVYRAFVSYDFDHSRTCCVLSPLIRCCSFTSFDELHFGYFSLKIPCVSLKLEPLLLAVCLCVTLKIPGDAAACSVRL